MGKNVKLFNVSSYLEAQQFRLLACEGFKQAAGWPGDEDQSPSPQTHTRTGASPRVYTWDRLPAVTSPPDTTLPPQLSQHTLGRVPSITASQMSLLGGKAKAVFQRETSSAVFPVGILHHRNQQAVTELLVRGQHRLDMSAHYHPPWKGLLLPSFHR